MLPVSCTTTREENTKNYVQIRLVHRPSSTGDKYGVNIRSAGVIEKIAHAVCMLMLQTQGGLGHPCQLELGAASVENQGKLHRSSLEDPSCGRSLWDPEAEVAA